MVFGFSFDYKGFTSMAVVATAAGKGPAIYRFIKDRTKNSIYLLLLSLSIVGWPRLCCGGKKLLCLAFEGNYYSQVSFNAVKRL